MSIVDVCRKTCCMHDTMRCQLPVLGGLYKFLVCTYSNSLCVSATDQQANHALVYTWQILGFRVERGSENERLVGNSPGTHSKLEHSLSYSGMEDRSDFHAAETQLALC